MTSDSSRCPAWCTHDGCHAGETVTAADGPSITHDADVALLVTRYHDEADELPPTVYRPVVALSRTWRSS